MSKTKKWQVTTVVGRVLDSHADYIYALQLAQGRADELERGVLLVREGSSLDDAEVVGATCQLLGE